MTCPRCGKRMERAKYWDWLFPWIKPRPKAYRCPKCNEKKGGSK